MPLSDITVINVGKDSSAVFLGTLHAILGKHDSFSSLAWWSDFLFGLGYLYFMPSKIYIRLVLLSVAGEKAVTGGPKFVFFASRLVLATSRDLHLN